MGSSFNVLAVRLVLVALVLAVGAVVVTHLPGGGSDRGRAASGGGLEFVLDGSALIVRMTSATPAATRRSIMGANVQLYCESKDGGGSLDTGPIQRWPEGAPEFRLATTTDYSKLPHPVCGLNRPDGTPIASATF